GVVAEIENDLSGTLLLQALDGVVDFASGLRSKLVEAEKSRNGVNHADFEDEALLRDLALQRHAEGVGLEEWASGEPDPNLGPRGAGHSEANRLDLEPRDNRVVDRLDAISGAHAGVLRGTSG